LQRGPWRRVYFCLICGAGREAVMAAGPAVQPPVMDWPIVDYLLRTSKPARATHVSKI
jgi:hypothetical protein